MCKARWRSLKLKNDPEYVERIRKYDRDRKRKSSIEFTSRKKVTSPKKVTSRSIKSQSSTPLKKPPSYYKVLSTSKKVQDLLGPSPKTHTTILKHLLNKAIKSPRKSKCIGEFTSPSKANNYITPPKESVGKHLQKIAILRSKKKYK